MDTINLANSTNEGFAKDLEHKNNADGITVDMEPRNLGDANQTRVALAKERLILRIQVSRNGELESFPPNF